MNSLRVLPRKALLLIGLFALLGIGYKKRQFLLKFTFDQTIKRMNTQIAKKMDEKVELAQKCNQILEMLKQMDTQYYASGFIRKKMLEFLRFEKLDEPIQSIKGLDKQSPNYQRQKDELMLQYINQLVLFISLSLLFFRHFECLFYLANSLAIQKWEELSKLTNFDCKFVEQLLCEVQQDICQTLLATKGQQILSLVQNDQRVNPNALFDSGLTVVQEYIAKVKDIDLDSQKILQKWSMNVDQRINQLINLNGNDQNRLLQLGQTQTISRELIKLLIDLNTSPGMKTFWHYSLVFSFRKLYNRKLKHKLKVGEDKEKRFVMQIITLRKILIEEFYDEKSEENNNSFYTSRLKSAIQNKQKEAKIGPEEKQLTYNAIKEGQLKDLLVEAQRQMSRKLAFYGKIEDSLTMENQSIGF